MKLAYRILVLSVFLACSGVLHAADITITSPQAGAVVSSVIEVTATITPRPGEYLTSPRLLTVDGGSVPLFADKDGNFTGLLDTAKLSNGHQSLVVVTTPEGRDPWRNDYASESWGDDRQMSRAEITVLVRNPYQHYWGDIHGHSSYSDGAWYPSEAYKFARDDAKLDFFALTEHEEILTQDEFADVVAQAETYNAPGKFAALYGLERTNGDTGHTCYYQSRQPLLIRDLDNFYRALTQQGLVGHFNHPWPNGADADWRNDFQDFRYSPEGDEPMAMVEVRDLEEEACYLALLNNGWHVAPAGDKDSHQPNWGQGHHWTVALARELTRESMLEAMRSRRIYSSSDRNLRLDFTLDGEDMGARLSRPAGNYNFSLSLTDPDDADTIEQVDLLLDGKVFSSARPGKPTYQWDVNLTFAPGIHYCLVRVKQTGDKLTWSAPIWLSAYEYTPKPRGSVKAPS